MRRVRHAVLRTSVRAWCASSRSAVPVATLRSLGVRVKLGHSVYMGHHLLMIHQDDFSKALKVMKDYRMTFLDTFRQFFKSFRSEYKLK
jgi:hypothetical protein